KFHHKKFVWHKSNDYVIAFTLSANRKEENGVKHLKVVRLKRERFCDPSIHAGKDSYCMQEIEQFACRGDSGSGVMQKASPRKDYVMGVLSRGLDCDVIQQAMKRHLKRADDQFRGTVVTDTRNYLDWICLHSGVCEKHINRWRMKKHRIVMIY
ncbi:hypothetical protein TELCIR_19700, partial [Teladorsagia circumcincta]